MDDVLRKKVHINDSIEMASPSSQDENTGMVKDIIQKNYFSKYKETQT